MGVYPNGCSVHAAFEWPMHATGWSLPDVRKLCRMMRFEANFDGCSLGLESSAHEPLRKPWK
eukprot:147834-Heterocapsa_arctica.AAC.1